MDYVYIVQCSDNTLYTGWTNNLEKRIKAHNEGKGAKYTMGRRPIELKYFDYIYFLGNICNLFSHKKTKWVLCKTVKIRY